MEESEKNLRVGVFDSGVGGLTVLAECVRLAPHIRYFYIGDNAHAPYGSRPEEEIVSFVRAAMERFRALGVSAAVLACNTATAVCAERMREEFPFPIVGTEPAVRSAAAVCGNVLVLATPRTAESGRLNALLARFPRCRFTVAGLPDLAGAVERFLTQGIRFDLADHLPRGTFDGVVLGCTHYVFLREAIAAFYGAPVFDGNAGVARRLLGVLDAGLGEAEWSASPKINKSLPFKWSEASRKSVVFLGKSAQINAKIFEQTFSLSDFFRFPPKEG